MCCKTRLRRSRATLLPWGAMLALALLALAPGLHSHDTANEHDDTCVLCHACGWSFISPLIQDNLDPTFGGEPHALSPRFVRNAEIKSNGSRAPPA